MVGRIEFNRCTGVFDTEEYNFILEYMPKDYQVVDIKHEPMTLLRKTVYVYIHSEQFDRNGDIKLMYIRNCRPSLDGDGIDQYNRLDFIDFRRVSSSLGIVKIGHSRFGFEPVDEVVYQMLLKEKT